MIQKKEVKMGLANSLISLMKKKPLERITVSDVTKNCEMCRENFYYHFMDKYDLIRWIYEDKIYEKAISNLKGAVSEEELTENCVEWVHYFRENRDFVQSALKDNSPNGLHNSLVNSTIKIITLQVKGFLGTNELSKDMLYHIHHYAYGKITVIENWLFRGMVDSDKFVAEMMIQSMSDKMKKVYFTDSRSLNQSYTSISS
jgi:AcrR family transcriptional regulator